MQDLINTRNSLKTDVDDIWRAYWRWNHKYQLPKYCGITPLLQVILDYTFIWPNQNLNFAVDRWKHAVLLSDQLQLAAAPQEQKVPLVEGCVLQNSHL